MQRSGICCLSIRMLQSPFGVKTKDNMEMKFPVSSYKLQVIMTYFFLLSIKK